MRGQHADKIWMGGGALAAVLLTLLTWLLLVGPKNDETASTRLTASENIDKAAIQQETLKRLEQDNVNLPTYQAELADVRRAVPQSDEFPDLLRGLREIAEKNGIDVTTLSAAGAEKVADSSPAIYDMPLSMGVVGDADAVQRFLNDLQQHFDRAVLIDSVNVAGETGTIDGKVTISIALHVFVSGDAPTADGGAPAAG